MKDKSEAYGDAAFDLIEPKTSSKTQHSDADYQSEYEKITQNGANARIYFK